MNSENNTNRGSRPVNTQNIGIHNAQNPQNPPLRRRKLTEEEIAERKIKEAERRRERRQTFFVRFVFGAAVYLVCCLLIVGIVAALYLSSGGESTPALSIVNGQDKELYRIPADSFIMDGTPYISATGLAYLYDFTLAGDKNQVTLHFHNIDQSISLYKDSSSVLINGSFVRIGAPIIFKNDYYIPMELIKNYFVGAIISYDSKKGVAKLSVAGDVGFTLTVHAPTETVPA
ncbi:MAG: hypothetical protein IKK83_02985 [Clostridia bacterium]|nr:hypothetical protein [Clostridia bacterium]